MIGVLVFWFWALRRFLGGAVPEGIAVGEMASPVLFGGMGILEQRARLLSPAE